MPEENTTQLKLLTAAIEVIDRDGIKAVRVRDIAARAGVKEPSVYHYFGNRDGLIEAAQSQRYSRGLTELTSAFDRLVRSCSNVEEFQNVVTEVLSAVFASDRQYIRAVRADVLGSAMSRPGLKMAVAQAQASSQVILVSAIEFAQSQGWVHSGLNAEAFAVWYTGMVNGRVAYEIDPDQCDPLEWNRVAQEATLYLLRQK